MFWFIVWMCYIFTLFQRGKFVVLYVIIITRLPKVQLNISALNQRPFVSLIKVFKVPKYNKLMRFLFVISNVQYTYQRAMKPVRRMRATISVKLK